jgi:Flp pilus assembly protein TadD
MWKSLINTLLLITAVMLNGCQSLPEKDTASQPVVVPAGAKSTYARAVEAVKAGRNAQAIQLFIGLTQQYPDFAASYTNLGLLYLKNNRLVEAEQVLNQAITLNPTDAIAYNHLGVVLRQRGEFELARQAYMSALRIKADYAGAHLNLGILHDIYLHDLGQALQNYQDYQALTGENDKQVAKWIVDLQRRVNSKSMAGAR